MLVLDRPRIDLTSKAVGGEEASMGEVFDTTLESMRYVDNANSRMRAWNEAYDERIDAIKKATGVELENPLMMNDRPFAPDRVKTEDFDPHADFRKKLEELAAQHPEARDIIGPDRDVFTDAISKAKTAEKKAADTWSRSSGGLGSWAARISGGLYGALHDPLNIGTLAIGPTGAAGAGARGLLWMSLKQGIANSAGEALIQPSVQAWRKEAGLDYGISQAALNVGLAGLLGFGVDAGVRSGIRGVRSAIGHPYQGPTPVSPIAALDQVAKNAPDGSMLKRASDGDEEALRQLVKDAGIESDPGVRRFLDEVEIEKMFGPPERVDDGQHLSDLARAVREESGALDLPTGDAIRPMVTREVARLADEVQGAATQIEGKPVNFRSVDPRDVTADAATFQFKSGGDAAGVTERLRGVTRWDPVSAGKAIVFERADGKMVIADGHQRLGLAQRLASQGQDAKLDAFIFREADGWTPEDVRAYAALKNMRESSGASIDMARVMRDRPDLIDGSLPLSDAKLREAAMLARLDGNAFDAVVGGRVPPAYGSLVGEAVTDRARHLGLIEELAAAGLPNTQQARLYLKQLMELPSTVEVQQTLFGEETMTRSVLLERTKVLDSALKSLRTDKRIFGLLEKEAGSIEGAGNVLAREANQAKAEKSAQLADLIEKLATSRGEVSAILNDAAASVARGFDSKLAARAFVARIGDILEREGIPGLLKVDESPAPDLAPMRMDDPVGPEAKAQTEEIEAQIQADQEVMLALRAFHGTPHDFDRFDMSAIGTGEGAQSFGHGLYFAENEAVAKSYQDNLSSILVDGKVADIRSWDYAWAKAKLDGTLDESIRDYRARRQRLLSRPANTPGRRWDINELTDQLERMERVAKADVRREGNLYEVDIDVEPEQLLDWDRPLNEQPPAVQEAIRKLGVEPVAYRNGQWLYEELWRGIDGDRDQVSAMLREAGIPGIRYLDAGSRDAGEGSRNIVVFEDSLIKITHKNGKAVTGAERQGVVGQMMGVPGFHASPYDFPEFSIVHEGKGQGQSLHGPGLYFGSTEDVAKFFGRTIAKQQGYISGLAKGYLDRANGDFTKALADIAEKKKAFEGEALKHLEGAEAELRKAPPGFLYRTLLNASSDEMVQGDVRLADQPAGEKLLKLIGDYDPDAVRVTKVSDFQEFNPLVDDQFETILPRAAADLTGEQAIAILRLRGADNASLTKSGIRGMSYVEGDDAIKGQKSYVVFDPKVIEMASRSEGMFALRGFFSPAIRVAETISMKKGTGEQFWKQITKAPGVRKDELEWMGLEEFLKGKASVTRDEVLAFMRAHQVELDEKVLTREPTEAEVELDDTTVIEWAREESGATNDAELVQWMDGYLREAEAGRIPDLDDGEIGAVREARDLVSLGQAGVATKFSGHKVPGGENYRELLIRLPKLEGKYTSKHFQDQEIVHLRVDDRTGPNGEKVLFINEVQSDLHQAGRRSGYDLNQEQKAALVAERRAERDRLQQEFNKLDLAKSLTDEQRQRRRTIPDEIRDLDSKIADAEAGGAPNAPFKGDLWLELALKRALLYAAENGYDAISWARSDQIAKAVGADPEKLALQYDQKIGKFLDKYTKKWGGKVEEATAAPTEEILSKLKDEESAVRARLASSRLDPDTNRAELLERLDQIKEAIEGNPSFAVDGNSNPLLRITPQMRASVMEGQPLSVPGKTQSATASLRSSTLSPRASEQMESVRAEIDKLISRALPSGWRAEVRQHLVFGDLPETTQKRNPGVPPSLEIEGIADPYERLIYVSMAALDPVERAYEEAGHALKMLRLIPEADYDILRAKAKEINARERFKIDERYGEVYGARWKDDPARLESGLEEEAIMQMVAARARGDDFGKEPNTILDRLVKFLRAVRDMLGIKGFRTFDDVFEDMTEGGFARQSNGEASFAQRLSGASEVMAAVGGSKGPQMPGGKMAKQIRNLINQAAVEGKLSPDDAKALIDRYNALEQFHKDGGKAREQLSKELEAEAAHRKRQAALSEAARNRVETTLKGFRDARGQPDPAKAMVAMIENLGQHELPEGTLSVANHMRAIFGLAMADLDGMLHEFRKTIVTGQIRNKARLSNVVRELFGEKTGDDAATVFAQSAKEVMEKLRQRFNAAGGAIGQRQDWGLPQWHDPVALLRAGKEAWITDIAPRLDLERMKHPLTGNEMTPADLKTSLSWIYDNIVSDGWHEKEASMAFRGLGAIANQRGDHRFLVFKDADNWMQYAERFGNGSDALAVIVNHIRGMSEDIAAMEVLGPNPRGMLTYMQQFVEQQAARRVAGMPAAFPSVTEITGRKFEAGGLLLFARDPRDYAKRMIARADNMWAFYRGHASAGVGDRTADLSQAVRNANVLTKLGGAAVSSLADLFWQTSARKFAGLPVTKTINDVVHQLKPGAEREARRAGIIADTYLHMHNEAAREAASMSATRITSYLAERVLSLSMLNTITRAGNHAMSMGIQAHMADQTAKSFRELAGPLQRLLRRHGLGEGDWDAIRLDASGNPLGDDFLTPAKVREVLVARGANPQIAERYLSMVLYESQYATLTGTLRARAQMYGGTKAGTLEGEAFRHFWQFKSFAVNLAILQIERMAREFVSQGFWRGAQFGAYALISATLGGALVSQLQQLRNGKDPRDMTKPEFWFAALYQSGGLSIYGDLLHASENRFGGGITQTIAGPTPDAVKDIVSLTYGSAKKSFLGEDTSAGKEFARMVRKYTPGSSIWYVRTAWDRVLMDNLQRLLDPQAEVAFRRQIQNMRRDYKQDYWWKPGRSTPIRAPNVSAAVPTLQ